MKFIYLISVLILSSCCLGERKCNQGSFFGTFRLVNSLNNQDLVFGANELYNKDSIKFYSLNGNDTVFHNYNAGAFSGNAQDSFLMVGFDYSKKEIVYVRLNAFDIDTLKVVYETITPQCCDPYSTISAFSYNNTMLETNDQGVSLIKK